MQGCLSTFSIQGNRFVHVLSHVLHMYINIKLPGNQLGKGMLHVYTHIYINQAITDMREITYMVYSGTSLLWTPFGQFKPP